jgi:hypothetical protein
MRATAAPQAAAAGPTAYETDFYTWAMEQAALLRAGHANDADLGNIAEELEGLARSEYRELRSSLARILQHMLKWDHQPERRSRSWAGSIGVHRVRVEQCLEDNPGLKARTEEALAQAYKLGVASAVKETRLQRSTFPDTCPYDWQQVMERPFDIGGDG